MNKHVFLSLALSAAFVAKADITGLTDLTDDLDNRAAISGNDNISGTKSNGAYAFNLTGATQSSVNADLSRFGGQDHPLWVIYEFKTNTIVNAYRVWNQGSSKGSSQQARSPKSFQLEGSFDGETWITIDSHSNEKQWATGEARVFEFDNPIAYKFYRMSITARTSPATANDNYIIIQELEYFYRPVAADSILVEGNPTSYGTPTPAYGSLNTVQGAEHEFSIETPYAIADGQVAGCLGWTAYTRNPEDLTTWNVYESGSDAVATFTHPGGAVRWVWQFAISNRIDVAVRGEGSVSLPAENWCLQDESLTVKATPVAGYEFIRWMGDTDGIEDVAQAGITIRADMPRKLTAFFAPIGARRVMYVSPDGSDENDGSSLKNAKASVGAAVKYLDQTYMEGTVFVAPGMYEQASQIVLSNAIEVVGMTGRPQDVILRNVTSAAWNNKECRVFHLRNANALVMGMTMEKGSVYDKLGGNVFVSGEGGTVSNCIIRSGFGSANGKGANVALDSANAVITHCTISDAALSIYESQTGVAAYFTGNGGRLSNCLIMRNATATNTLQKVSHAKPSGAWIVFMESGTMDNCSIVDNCHTGLVAAVYAKGDGKNLRVVNCVIAKNSLPDGSSLLPWSGGDKNKFANCVTDGTDPINGSCKIGTVDEMFVNANDGKWQPLPGGLLANAGTTDGLAVPAVDLKGNPRIHGDAIDVGCYEVYSAGFFIRIR